jgi:hypothetical protein
MAASSSSPPCVGLDATDVDGAAFSDLYVLGSKMGDGGTASVFTVVRRETGEALACKLVSRKQGMKWARAVRTFQHEGEMLRLCQHAHGARSVASLSLLPLCAPSSQLSSPPPSLLRSAAQWS